MENKSNKTETEQIKELILLWLKHWHYFVISFAVCGIIGIIYLKTATPVMNISARVGLRHDESLIKGAIPRSNAMLNVLGFGGGDENIEDETLKMRSQGYIKQVVKNLDLNKKYILSECWGFSKTELFDASPIDLSVDPVRADTISKAIIFTLDVEENKTKITVKAGKDKIGKLEVTSFPVTMETSWGNFTLNKTPYYDRHEKPLKLKILYTGYDYMAQIYQNKLFIDFEKKTSDLIDLNFKSENIHFAKKLLKEVIDTYNREWEIDNGLVSQKTFDFIDYRIARTKDLLLGSDINIQRFKDRYNLTDITADITYYFKAAGELQAGILDAETKLNIADMIVEFAQDEKNKYALIPFSLILTDSDLSGLINRYNGQLTRRNELYRSNEQSALVQNIDKQLEIQRDNLLTSLKNVKEGLLITRNNLKQKEKEFNSKISNIPSIERDFLSMRREQELQQSVYIVLLEMREQAAIKGTILLPKLKIINSPYVLNKKASPRLINVALIVFILGMGFPLLLIYGLPLLRTLKKNKLDLLKWK
jgi:uncharacterized protein involved in exopolysaccharide biosynthesis